MFLVSDAMTRAPVTVFPEDDLVRAQQLMAQRRLRHLPVVQNGTLVGLVTHRDLLRELGGTPSARAEVLTVRDVMVTEVVTAHPATPLRHAARILYDRKFGCLPVVDEERRVVGMLTATDFIRFAAEIATDFDRVEAAATR